MILAVNRIFVHPQHHGEFEERLQSRLGMVENAPGFVRLEILRPMKGEDYLILTWWESQEDFERWTRSEAFQKAHARPTPREWFSRDNEFGLYETMILEEV